MSLGRPKGSSDKVVEIPTFRLFCELHRKFSSVLQPAKKYLIGNCAVMSLCENCIQELRETRVNWTIEELQ